MKKLKLYTVALTLVLLMVSQALALVKFSSLELKGLTGEVRISWKMEAQEGCTEFVIERALAAGQFTALPHTFAVEASGHTYVWTDTDIFKDKSRTFRYRIRAKMANDQSVVSEAKTVTVNPTGIQQTWGGLKAMFR